MANCVTITVTEAPTKPVQPTPSPAISPELEKYLPYAVIAGAILLAIAISRR